MRIGVRTATAAALLVLSATVTACGSSGRTAPAAVPRPTATASPTSPTSPASTTIAPSVETNPFTGRSLWIDPQSKAAEAAATLTGADADVVRRLAQTPTAVWLTPENLPTADLDMTLADRLGETGDQLPVLVVYGIPQRDCSGGHSAGGLDAPAYLDWIRALAAALTGSPVIILEPDALASAPGCGLVQQREELLSAAIASLAEHASIYVDAGHSNWVDPAQMATMLSTIGVERVRGFSVNVSSFGADSEERQYAEAIRATLPKAGYVIDSSRNGRGGTGEWCNPADRALGEVPGVVTDGSGLDAHLWIKPPAESDGTCGGGPEAGAFWLDRALSLAHNAGW